MALFGERLKLLREQKELSQEALGKIFHLTQSIIAHYEAGRKQPSQQTLRKFADFFNVSVDYLLGRTDTPHPLHDISLIPGAFPIGKTVKLPVLGVIRAGNPVLAVENIIGWEEVQEEDIRGGEYFFLKITGDSMVDEHMPNGSLVLVRKQDYAENGDIVVALVNGEEATVKKYKPFNGNKILLMPANAAYEPQLYDAKEVKIIGIVIESRIKKK